MKRVALGLVALCCAGCASTGLQSLPRVPMTGASAAVVRAQFERSLPESFQLVNTVVFQFHGFRFSSLGYVAVDARARSFAVVGMNPAGVKLFEICGTNEQVTSRFMIAEFPHREELIAAIGQAIREIYLDLVPPPGAAARTDRYAVVFSDAGTEYVFGGAAQNLVEKRHRRGWRCDRRIGFYSYQEKDGKQYPGLVVFQDRRYGYSLTVRIKEIRGQRR